MGEHRLPHDETATGTARTTASREIGSILPRDRIEDVHLMVTELVSNAVRHAPAEEDGSVVLDIQREPGVIRVVVRDGGRHMDLDEPTFHTETDGHYGLFVVDNLADRWGFSIDGDKGVWFEVDVE